MCIETKIINNLQAVVLRKTRVEACRVAQQIALTNCLQRTEIFLRTWAFSAMKETLPTVHYPVHKRSINPIHNLPLCVSTTYFPSSSSLRVSARLLSSYLSTRTLYEFILYTTYNCGPAKRRLYSELLWYVRLKNRIPVGARFSAFIQIVPGANPSSYGMVTASLQWEKRTWACGFPPTAK